MKSKLSFYCIVLALMAAGYWGVNRLQFDAFIPSNKQSNDEQNASNVTQSFTLDGLEEADSSGQPTSQNQTLNHYKKIESWLQDSDFLSAESYINRLHSSLSSDELDGLKRLFLRQSRRTDAPIRLLQAATRLFDDLETWDALANAAIMSQDWQTSFSALMRASQLENSSPDLENKLAYLVKASSYLRAELEKHSDEIGIRNLYQQLYDQHPSYPRFQLELAYSHLRLNEYEKAERLLEGLRYDPQLGEVAEQALARIEQDSKQRQQSPVPEPPTAASSVKKNDIVVPLIRSGNSFFVKTTVENRTTTLLLDTGASITALSTDLIKRLDLTPTGQVINLSTANGIRQARLFRAGRVQLGRVRITGLVVAEIDLPSRSGFQGLLGTDALNQSGDGYSYLIDNKENALIFRRR